MSPEVGDLARPYRPQDVEPVISERWLAADIFAPDGLGSRTDWSRPPFVIIQPPPNVTGALHIGHALTFTIEDVLVRRARMIGRPTLWLPGLDHASIAAQVVLDRILEAEGHSRQSLGRERYLERMWAFVEQTRSVIGDQSRRLGISVDWSRLRFTMDEISSRAVRTAFRRLYEEGLAYRTEALVNWCPSCLTSLSDLEVVATPENGSIWSIRYHLIGEDGTIDPERGVTVATTRPETLLGDTAVAVHPDDPRYRELIGRDVLLPFVDRRIPIIADEAVEREFGTGAVKVTPAHDHTDYEIGRRHGLPMITVLDDHARIAGVGGAYEGLPRQEARQRIVADLEARGDLVEVKPHELVIGRCQRSDDVVEPRLKTQWFVRTRPMADRAMAAVREGRTRFVPSRFEGVFADWMDRIHDWNVSRQLWWGHRIPAWYCPEGHATVTDLPEGPDSCVTCGRPAAELRQDEDIFDTWFSSGLWPFSTLGWPDETDDLRRFYPGSVMETGYDIIFFWVARMMMLGEWLMDREPFEVVYLHGMVRDSLGAKMSKTRGNVVDPLGVIDEVGADALRFALVNGTSPGNDQRLSPERLEGARNFANKLWNATRFVLSARASAGGDPDVEASSNGSEQGAEPPEAAVSTEMPDLAAAGPAEHWIIDRCHQTTIAVEQAYESFQLGEVARLLHEAIWSDYCDWYLELAKVTLGDETVDAPRRQTTWNVLAWVLDRYLRLLHPVMPHLTEALWGRLPRHSTAGLLAIAPWPTLEPDPDVDRETAAAVEGLLELVRGIRNARAEAGVEAGAWLEAQVLIDDPTMRVAYPRLEPAFARLARVRPGLVSRDAVDADPGEWLAVIVTGAEARLARSGADLEREHARLVRELEEARAQRTAVQGRLANAAFVERAPAAVVEQARARAAELDGIIERLETRLG